METTIQQQPSNKKRKTILVGMGVAVASVLGYFGWQYWRKKKIQDMDTTMVDEPSPTKKPSNPVTRNDKFPLKRGSRGQNVKMLQQALMAKHGAGILPKYGADGDFGSETAEALKKLNLPASIDQATLQLIAAPSGVKPPVNPLTPGATTPPASLLNAKQVASEIYQSILRRDINAAIAALKKLSSTTDYSAVSTAFQSYRVNGVKQTLVNGLLNTFKDAAQKSRIQAEFTRMGLRFDGSKWSLSGIAGLTLITTAPTVVWKDQNTPVQVAQRTVLGKEITRRNQHVVFENGGNKFLVKESDVTYLTA